MPPCCSLHFCCGEIRVEKVAGVIGVGGELDTRRAGQDSATSVTRSVRLPVRLPIRLDPTLLSREDPE